LAEDLHEAKNKVPAKSRAAKKKIFFIFLPILFSVWNSLQSKWFFLNQGQHKDYFRLNG